MRKYFLTALIVLALFGCQKPVQPVPESEPIDYDFKGRIYAKPPMNNGDIWGVYDFYSEDSVYYYFTRNSWDGEYVTGLKHPRGYSFDSINGMPVIVLKAYSIIDDTVVWNYKIVDNERFVELIYDEDDGCYYEGNIFDRRK